MLFAILQPQGLYKPFGSKQRYAFIFSLLQREKVARAKRVTDEVSYNEKHMQDASQSQRTFPKRKIYEYFFRIYLKLKRGENNEIRVYCLWLGL
jgi:hypothetical protein